MVFNDDVTPSETNVQCFSNPGEESAKGEDATENGCSQGKTCFLLPHQIYVNKHKWRQ